MNRPTYDWIRLRLKMMCRRTRMRKLRSTTTYWLRTTTSITSLALRPRIPSPNNTPAVIISQRQIRFLFRELQSLIYHMSLKLKIRIPMLPRLQIKRTILWVWNNLLRVQILLLPLILHTEANLMRSNPLFKR